MKKILVTGCNGQLGRAIRAEYAKEDVTFINTDVVEGDGVTALDIADVDAVLALVRAERPQVIINCAAHCGSRRKADTCVHGLCVRRKRDETVYGIR